MTVGSEGKRMADFKLFACAAQHEEKSQL